MITRALKPFLFGESNIREFWTQNFAKRPTIRTAENWEFTFSTPNFFDLEIPDFLSDQECQQLISLAKESGLRTSVAGNQSYEGDLDEVMKEAGKHAHLYWVQLLYTNECLSWTLNNGKSFKKALFSSCRLGKIGNMRPICHFRVFVSILFQNKSCCKSLRTTYNGFNHKFIFMQIKFVFLWSSFATGFFLIERHKNKQTTTTTRWMYLSCSDYSILWLHTSRIYFKGIHSGRDKWAIILYFRFVKLVFPFKL